MYDTMINWHLSFSGEEIQSYLLAWVAGSDASLMAQPEPNASDWSHQDTKSDSNVFLPGEVTIGRMERTMVNRSNSAKGYIAETSRGHLTQE